MTYFAEAGIVGADLLIDRIGAQLTPEGWVQEVMNTNQGVPNPGQMGKELWWRATGNVVQPAIHRVGVARIMEGTGSQQYLAFMGSSGWRNTTPVAIQDIVTAAGVTTINTTGAHGARIGDHILVNGVNANPAYNAAWPTGATPEIVQSTPLGTQLTSTGRLAGNIPLALGGNLLIPYNFTGSRGGSAGEKHIMRFDAIGPDPTFSMYGYVDELRFAAVIVSGGIHKMIFMGLWGRGHVQDDFSDVALTTAPIVGTGSAQVVTLDRVSPNLKVGPGGSVWLVPPDDSNGAQTLPRAAVEVLTITDKPSDTQVEIAPTGNYPAGTLIGKDPMPCVVCGSNSTGSASLDQYNWAATHRISGGVDPNPDDVIGRIRANVVRQLEGEIDPDEKLDYQGLQIWLNQTVGGARYPCVGIVGWPHGNQNDLDLMVVGEDIPANRWKVFPSLKADIVVAGEEKDSSVGPGAL
jgi:hypothetical protein